MAGRRSTNSRIRNRGKNRKISNYTAGYRQFEIQNRGSEPQKAISEPRTAVLPRYSAGLRTAGLRVTL